MPSSKPDSPCVGRGERSAVGVAGERLIASLAVASLIGVAAAPAGAQTTVAVIDSGVASFPPLDQALVPGFNFYDGNDDTSDDTANNHGTTVALVINKLAPNVRILPIKVTGPKFESSVGVIDAGINFAAAKPAVRVINISEGAVASATAMRAAASAGKVIVTQAGNEGQSQPTGRALAVPQLGGRGIVAGAVDGANKLLPNSNAAGDLAQFYLVAPGGNEFNSARGTSFATPHVSAAAATLFDTAPNLSPEQVVQILFDTADDLGTPGVDPVYGHGRLNIQRALSPQGGLDVADGSSSSSSSSGALAVAALGIGAAVGYAIWSSNKEKLAQTLVLDGYGRGYHVDLTNWATVRDTSPRLATILGSLDDEVYVDSLIDTEQNQVYAIVSKQVERNADDLGFALDPFDEQLEKTSMTFVGSRANGSSYALGLNAVPKSSFGAASTVSGPTQGIAFLAEDAFTTPFLGFTETGIGSQLGHRVSDDVELKFGLAQLDDHERYGLRSDSVLLEGTFERERFGVNAQLGYLKEDGSFFGGSSGGALSVDAAETFSVGLSGTVRVAPDMHLIGSYVQGYTNVDDRSRSMLQDFSDLRSNAFAVGLVSNDLFKRGDQIGFSYSRPLRVSSGEADLRVPYAQDLQGKIHSTNERIDLAPDGAEQLYEFYYQYRHKELSLGAHRMYRDTPLHEPGAAGEAAVVTTLTFHF